MYNDVFNREELQSRDPLRSQRSLLTEEFEHGMCTSDLWKTHGVAATLHELEHNAALAAMGEKKT